MRKYLTGFAILIFILVISSTSSAIQYSAQGSDDGLTIYFPMVANNHGGETAVIVNHLNTDIHEIPDFWINEARKYVIHYAHTSHGSQILSGLQWLEAQDSRYNISIAASGLVALPADTTAMRFYDGNNYSGTTYITPDMYWETSAGIEHTQSVVATGWFDLSLWT